MSWRHFHTEIETPEVVRMATRLSSALFTGAMWESCQVARQLYLGYWVYFVLLYLYITSSIQIQVLKYKQDLKLTLHKQYSGIPDERSQIPLSMITICTVEYTVPQHNRMYKPAETCCLRSWCTWVTRYKHATWKNLKFIVRLCASLEAVDAPKTTTSLYIICYRKVNLFNFLGENKTCSAGYCATIQKPISLHHYRSRPTHGNLILRIFSTHRGIIIQIETCPWYYLNYTQNGWIP